MADEASSNRGVRRRGRGQRGKLRRFQEIDHVVVEEPFALSKPLQESSAAAAVAAVGGDRLVGEGCYISATIQNRRYYGLLVEQSALKEASLLYFQDEASGLELNRRMKRMKEQQRGVPPATEEPETNEEGKRPADMELENVEPKKLKESAATSSTSSSAPNESTAPTTVSKQVQKFKYVEATTNSAGEPVSDYRLLLATYADVEAAAEGDAEKTEQILTACQSGGNFVGDYYYMYEVKGSSLETSGNDAANNEGLWMSMGFQTFLSNTTLPEWFPLSNLPTGQSKVLTMLNLKKDGTGNAVWDDTVAIEDEKTDVYSVPIPMEPRSRYRVIVVGAGIAGLSCCLELFKHAEREGINIEVTLLEGRSRIGGRLWTDRETFHSQDGKDTFPVDLGASWIHGIDLNPLATLAKEAGVDFVTTSEEVKMLQADMKEIDQAFDERAGELFDKLLDLAADESWKSDDFPRDDSAHQAAVRWYASVLDGDTAGGDLDTKPRPERKRSAPHRISSDTSVDVAIGNAIRKHKSADFASLSDEERRMLYWNLKNVEYALGANVSDLSMKFWDIDERHAFEGEHVILKQGYSVVVEYLLQTLEKYGDRFKCVLNFPVGKLEYARKTTTQAYPTGSSGRQRQMVDLSDTCCVSSEDGSESITGDFVVCAVPLGVLKESLSTDKDSTKLHFAPRLPFTKRDAIESVGFGLLDKVYLQFSDAFWRQEILTEPHQTLFGNASGVNPHHYMFIDIGKSLGSEGNVPAILMSLVSGREAVDCELLPDEDLVKQTMATLRTLFSKIDIPDPIAVRVTRWGSDKFSRGSYTFLPPGTTDQDFQLLQSPVNGNGDSILLEGSEIMRLFFAGEHTTALHPSMAHGAMLSGIRAANEVVSAINFGLHHDDSFDRMVPMSLFRHMNPHAPLECSLCHQPGTRVREGTLFAFKRGARQVLVHNNCAENSPEVEVYDGQWKDIVKACNRGKMTECFLCNTSGATIGCTADGCYRSFHFSCAEDTGWRFDTDGKIYKCDDHRTELRDECVKISVKFLASKRKDPKCALCGVPGDDRKAGELLAFRERSRMIAVHENCVKYTTIIETSENRASRFDKDFRNVVSAVDRAKLCTKCGRPGATVVCAASSCKACCHFPCALDVGWNLNEQGPKFYCPKHKGNRSKGSAPVEHSLFQHALFSTESNRANDSADVKGIDVSSKESDVVSHDSASEDEEVPIILRKVSSSLLPVTSEFPCETAKSRFVRVFRTSTADPWQIKLFATPLNASGNHLLSVAETKAGSAVDGLNDGDVLIAINGMKLGATGLDSVAKVLDRLNQEVDVIMEIQRETIK